jgi:hypothetical protein
MEIENAEQGKPIDEVHKTQNKREQNKDGGEKHACIDVLRVWRWYTWEVG